MYLHLRVKSIWLPHIVRSSDKISAVELMVFAFFLFIVDVGFIDKTTDDGRDNLVVDEVVAVDIIIVVAFAAS